MDGRMDVDKTYTERKADTLGFCLICFFYYEIWCALHVDSPPPCSGPSNTGWSQTTAIYLTRHKQRQPDQNILHFVNVIKMHLKNVPLLDVL